MTRARRCVVEKRGWGNRVRRHRVVSEAGAVHTGEHEEVQLVQVWTWADERAMRVVTPHLFSVVAPSCCRSGMSR